MKANQFFNKILNKWPIKVLCLVIAIAMYLFHQASLTDKRSFVIPLQLVEEGAVMHTGEFTSTVTVVIKASTEEMSSVHSNQLTAYVNLNEITKNGEYNLPVKIKVAEELMGYNPFEIKVKPEFVKIRAENKELKFIPIEASVVGEPEHGYEVSEVKVNPSHLEVTGPASIIENTTKIYTDKVDVTGLAKKESFEVEYKPVNKLLAVADNGPFEVTVTIEPKYMERTIEDLEVNVVSLNPKFYLKDDIIQTTVTLSGTMPVLENYTPGKRFAYIDCTNITAPGEYDLPIIFTVPAYFTLEESSELPVHITVLETEWETVEESGGGE